MPLLPKILAEDFEHVKNLLNEKQREQLLLKVAANVSRSKVRWIAAAYSDKDDGVAANAPISL